jgi:hypothetical protein
MASIEQQYQQEIDDLKLEIRQYRNALEVARVSLIHSKPTMAHYPEPVERHSEALKLVNKSLGYQS